MYSWGFFFNIAKLCENIVSCHSFNLHIEFPRPSSTWCIFNPDYKDSFTFVRRMLDVWCNNYKKWVGMVWKWDIFYSFVISCMVWHKWTNVVSKEVIELTNSIHAPPSFVRGRFSSMVWSHLCQWPLHHDHPQNHHLKYPNH
jgi:hypothetical protein